MSKRLHLLGCLTVIAISVGILAGGCDKFQSDSAAADEQLEQKIQQAMQQMKNAQAIRSLAIARQIDFGVPSTQPATRESGGAGALVEAQAELKKAKDLFDSANALTKADPSLLAFSTSCTGEFQFQQGLLTLIQAHPKVVRAQTLLSQLDDICDQLAKNKDEMALLGKFDPSQAAGGAAAVAPLKGTADQKAAFQKQKDDRQKELDAVNQQINDLNSQIQQATAEKTTTEAAMADLSQKASQNTGPAQHELERQLVEQREKASNLGAQIATLQIKLADQTQAAKGIQARMAQLDAAMGAMDSYGTQLTGGWTKVQQEQSDVDKQSQAIFGPPAKPDENIPTAVELARNLTTLINDINTDFTSAEASLDDAAHSYDTAATMAAKEAQELAGQMKDPKTPQITGDLLKKRIALNQASFYKTEKLKILSAHGQIYAMNALLLNRVAQIQKRFAAVDPRFTLSDLKISAADLTTSATTEANKFFDSIVAVDKGDAHDILEANDLSLVNQVKLCQTVALYWKYLLAYDESGPDAAADPLKKANAAYKALPADSFKQFASRIPEDLSTGALPVYHERTVDEVKGQLVTNTPPAPQTQPTSAPTTTPVAGAGSATGVAAAITDRTVAVIYINGSKVTPEQLEASVKAISAPVAANAAPMIATLKNAWPSLSQNFDGLTVVINLKSDPKPQLDAYMMLDIKAGVDPTAAQAALTPMFNGPDAPASEIIGGKIWLHDKAGAMPANPNADQAKVFSDALASADAPIVAVVSLSKPTGDALTKQIQERPQPITDFVNDYMASKYTLVAITLGDSPSIGVTILAADNAAAAKLSDETTAILGFAKTGIPPAATLIETIKPMAIDNKVTMVIDGKLLGPLLNAIPGMGGGTPPPPAP